MTYRSDEEALRARLAHAEGESAELRTLLDEIERRRARLTNVRVASPCRERWADMVGGDHVRHCARCDKSVYDLSSLTAEDAERLVEQHEGRLCVRFFRRVDGTMLTADCPDGRKRRRLRVLAAAGIATGLSGIAVAVPSTTLGNDDPARRTTIERTGPPMTELVGQLGDVAEPELEAEVAQAQERAAELAAERSKAKRKAR